MALSGAALSLPLWAVFGTVVLPVLGGHGPLWNLRGIRQARPPVVDWILLGAALGVLARAAVLLRARFFSSRTASNANTDKVRIVVIGGGFGGMHAALHLEEAFARGPAIDLTLISQTNAMLFTPMLAEVAASSIEASHISTPGRSMLPRTTVLRASVTHVDVTARRIVVAGDVAQALPYDHVVLALGAVSNFVGMKDVEERAFPFKSIVDAIRIRNHIIEMFERAEREPDEAVCRRLLTFAVAGGGFAGVELAGALNDFARGAVVDYPHIDPRHVRVILVHAHDRILEEVSKSLSAYAIDRMRARGVVFILVARIAQAGPGEVTLDTGERIATETLVWTAGAKPHPLIRAVGLEADKRGALVVEETLRATGDDRVWALGDCAAVPDIYTGKACAPTAQIAMQQSKMLAKNLRASVRGAALLPFRYRSLGSMCVIGYQAACAEIRLPFDGRRLQFSGLFAWILWRATYLAKLPGAERRLRVLFDWSIDLFFARDLAQTIDLE